MLWLAASDVLGLDNVPWDGSRDEDAESRGSGQAGPGYRSGSRGQVLRRDRPRPGLRLVRAALPGLPPLTHVTEADRCITRFVDSVGAVDARLSPDGKTLSVTGGGAYVVSTFAVDEEALTELASSPTPLPAEGAPMDLVVL